MSFLVLHYHIIYKHKRFLGCNKLGLEVSLNMFSMLIHQLCIHLELTLRMSLAKGVKSYTVRRSNLKFYIRYQEETSLEEITHQSSQGTGNCPQVFVQM